jgi:TfoX/Sxy family transcriptional regulator of competence genes
MAYNERLAERVRAALASRRGVAERRMFGGLAFLLEGKMCVGVLGDELVVRCGAERYAKSLRSKHAREMDFTGRPMTGMVYVAPSGTRGTALERWIELGMAGAAASPASKRRKKAATRAGSAALRSGGRSRTRRSR